LALAGALAVPLAVSAQDEQPAADTAKSAYTLPGDIREQAVELRDSAAENSRAFETVTSLTTEVGNRLAGSAGDRAAVAWALLKLRELGFDNVRAEKVNVPHWVRGNLDAEIAAPFPQHLVATSLGGSIGTTEEGIEAPVIMADNMAALKDMDPDDVGDKIVFIADPMQRTRDGSGYGKAVMKRVNGAAEAARLGARAVVIRSVGTGNSRIAHTGITIYNPEVRRIPAIAISNPDADMLQRQLATGHDVTVRIASTARYLPPAESANVIGEIPGSDDDAGMVLLAAHLDSWDVGTGAIDDGAGVAIVTEAARLVGEMHGKPKRTIRVVLFANEEFGLSGAKAYAKAHADEIGDHVLAMEADFGAGRVWRLGSNVPEDQLPRVAAFARLLEPLGVERGENGSEGGADIGPLNAKGVPVLAPVQDGTHYFDWHHTIDDTPDKIDPAALNQNVAVYATLAYLAANLDEDFGRVPEHAEEPGFGPGSKQEDEDEEKASDGN